MTPAPCRYCHQPMSADGSPRACSHGSGGDPPRPGDHSLCEATTGEPSADAREAARKAWNDAWRAPVSNGMGGYNVGTDRKDVATGIIAEALDAFAARAVERERERLREMVANVPHDIWDIIDNDGDPVSAPIDALAVLVADLRAGKEAT